MSEQVDTAALVKRVRRGFAEYGDDTEMVVSEADAALDSLTAVLERTQERVRQLEEEIRAENKWPGERKHGGWEYKDRA